MPFLTVICIEIYQVFFYVNRVISLTAKYSPNENNMLQIDPTNSCYK